MRVLQVMSGAKVGGAETYFVDLVSALHRAGLEQRIVIRRNETRAHTLRQVGLDPVELPFCPVFDVTTRHALARQIEDFRPDIVQTWMSRASSVPIEGDCIHVGWLGGYYDLKYFRNCDELVGVTRDLADYVVGQGWLRSHAHYLPTFAVYESALPLSRKDFDTPNDVPLILALGRLHEHKGFDVLLKALVNVPKAYLWLAGDGPLEKQLKNLAKELGIESRVRFLGWRNDRAALFASCDMCVMPSRVEPFGTVMIEAWAHHCPLIAAASKGPSGLIKNGENGLLVPIDDVAALTKAMRALIDQPNYARAMAETAWNHYQAHYTEAAVVRQYLSFYEGLIKNRSSYRITYVGL